MKYFFTLIAIGLLSGQLAYADDTEIYRSTDNRVNPNVVFLIDTSGSMAYKASGDYKPSSNESSRLDIVKNAAKNAIQALDPSLPINISIMRFDERNSAGSSSNGGAYGGFVTLPFTPTDSTENKNKLISNINNMTLSNIGGGTPITESLTEAYRYIKGDTAVYGYPKQAEESCSPWWGCSINYLKGISTYFSGNSLQYGSRDLEYIGSTPASMDSNGKYKSPVEATCQKNHIVLFTDGMASSDAGANSFISNKVSNMSFPSGLSKNCDGNEGCAVPFAYYLQNTDHFQDKDITGEDDPNATEVKQNISLHVVGGFAGITSDAEKMLNNAALYGHPLTEEHYTVVNGKKVSKHYYKSDDEEGLTKALLDVFGGISSTAGNFAAPSVAINAFNSLEHGDEVYFSIFQPGETPGWSGNIKRYRMDSDGKIRDSKGNLAIDSSTGTFAASSRSFWSTEDDGPVVTKGGMASKMPGDRNVYTNLGSGKSILSNGNRVNEDNSSITSNMLNGLLPASHSNLDDTDRKNILQWARGLDPVSGLARKTLADPLHSTPALVSYMEGSSKKDVLYVGTNAGYIHAFNTDKDSPSEEWAFIPKELLPNLAVYQTGLSKYLKTYGIDGPMTVYHTDTNKNRLIDSGEKAYLAAGMRRGGRNYYLLDISSRTTPLLEAQITGGSGDFVELGQTWSKMIPATINWNGQKAPVYFFGGGYDTSEDNNTSRKPHSQGNAIYMVAADNSISGKKPFDLLWKVTGRSSNPKGISISDMTSGFVSNLTLVDNIGNGTIDIIYAADVGGRVWRFDINDENSGANNFAQGGIIADFNDGTEAGNIRFFTKPDVVYTEYGQFEFESDDNPDVTYTKSVGRYQIAIGSGFRANPLSTKVKDKIFVINDFDINGAPESGYNTLSVNDLANIKSFDNGTIEQRQNGFYYELTSAGEKVISDTLTINDAIYIPTFRPTAQNAVLGCEPDIGLARMIMLKPMSSSSTNERVIEQVELKEGGIPPNPFVFFPPGGKDPVIIQGKEVFDVEGDPNSLQKTYWREK